MWNMMQCIWRLVCKYDAWMSAVCLICMYCRLFYSPSLCSHFWSRMFNLSVIRCLSLSTWPYDIMTCFAVVTDTERFYKLNHSIVINVSAQAEIWKERLTKSSSFLILCEVLFWQCVDKTAVQWDFSLKFTFHNKFLRELTHRSCTQLWQRRAADLNSELCDVMQIVLGAFMSLCTTKKTQFQPSSLWKAWGG